MERVEETGHSSRKPSLLIVDDDEAIRHGITLWLDESYEIACESDGAGACGRFAIGDRFSVVLCDLMMPSMTGIDLYEWMRGACPEQAERVIFMTGGFEHDPTRRFLRALRHRPLLKPFNRAELIERIEAVLGARADP